MCHARGFHREQLVDLTSDPGEMVNGAVEARHAPRLEVLSETLREHCYATDDPFACWIPQGACPR